MRTIEKIDQRMLMTEQQSLLGPPAADWGFTVEPFLSITHRWSPEVSYRLFGWWLNELFDIRVPEMTSVPISNRLSEEQFMEAVCDWR